MWSVFVAAGIVFGGVEAAPAGEKLRRIRAVAADQLRHRGHHHRHIPSVSIVVVSGQSEQITT